MSKYSFPSQNFPFQNTSLISVISIAIKQNISYPTYPFEIFKELINNYRGGTYNTPLRTVKQKFNYVPKTLKPDKGGKQ